MVYTFLGSVISVRDISKLNKYVYIEPNINGNINRQLRLQ